MHYPQTEGTEAMIEEKTENAVQELFPYLIVRDAKAAIDFYQQVFGAEEMFRLEQPSGRIGHAQLKFGAAVIMLADESSERGIQSPLAFGGAGSFLHLHVSDVDELTNRAVAAGAKILVEPKTQFYGERTSKVIDPYGHVWMLGSHVEAVSTDEMQRRYTALLAKIG
jgi:PhnB protein